MLDWAKTQVSETSRREQEHSTEEEAQGLVARERREFASAPALPSASSQPCLSPSVAGARFKLVYVDVVRSFGPSSVDDIPSSPTQRTLKPPSLESITLLFCDYTTSETSAILSFASHLCTLFQFLVLLARRRLTASDRQPPALAVRSRTVVFPSPTGARLPRLS